jgi:hypothetical protein
VLDLQPLSAVSRISPRAIALVVRQQDGKMVDIR